MHSLVKILSIISVLLLAASGIQYIQAYFDGYETRIVYVEIPYQEPIYKTLYSGTLTYSVLGANIAPPYSFKDATSYEIKQSWGLGAYSIQICLDSEGCKTHLANGGYDQIQAYTSQIVIGNETKYRTEPREVTKKRLDWLFS